MPHGPAHKKQAAKNWVILGLLCGLAILFYSITLIRL